MRLIDADALIGFIVEEAQDLRTLSTKTVGQAISKTPTVDAVPVIRCKDCKYYKVYELLGGTLPLCNRIRTTMADALEPGDFCSRAERKEE